MFLCMNTLHPVSYVKSNVRLFLIKQRILGHFSDITYQIRGQSLLFLTVCPIYMPLNYLEECPLSMSCIIRNLFSGFTTLSHTNQAAQPSKMLRGLKFRIQEVEEIFYLCSENKGADQLRSYCVADLRLCFRICTKLVFSVMSLS